jgi:hypothetical protein
MPLQLAQDLPAEHISAPALRRDGHKIIQAGRRFDPIYRPETGAAQILGINPRLASALLVCYLGGYESGAKGAAHSPG